jgi:hypothetical protein
MHSVGHITYTAREREYPVDNFRCNSKRKTTLKHKLKHKHKVRDKDKVDLLLSSSRGHLKWDNRVW